jgi:hypothetical protein
LPTQDETWRIRLRDSDGRIRGPGILICGRYAITSAQVAASTLKVEAQDIIGWPSGQVCFDIPAKPALGMQRAEIIWWRPAVHDSDDSTGLDIAGLSIAGPAIRDVDEPPFLLDPGSNPRIVQLQTCSSPTDDEDQLPAWARLPGHSENDHDRILLNPVTENWPHLTREYHGSEVIDAQTGEILGIAMTAPSRSSRDQIWMTPVGKIAAEWPVLHRIVEQGKRDASNKIPSYAFSRHDILPLVDTCLRISALVEARSRHQIVSELPLDVMLTAPRSSVDRADLTGLLWRCAHVPGALSELAGKIREISSGRRIAGDLADDLARFQRQVAGGEIGSST